MAPAPKWADDQVEEMLKRMSDGEALTSIARDHRMPSIDSMNRWEAERETELGAAITRARELGWTVRAEKAVERAQTCEDASLGRLDFDAERWYLGKMHPKKFGDAATLKLADANGEKIAMDDTAKFTRLAALVSAIKGVDNEFADDAG